MVAGKVCRQSASDLRPRSSTTGAAVSVSQYGASMAPAKLLAAPAKGVAARSIRRTRWPRCASVRACQRPVIPAPTTVITAVCMTCAGAWRALFSSPLWRSIPEGQALAARVGPAFEQTVGAPDDQVRARGQKVGADAVSVRLHFERMPDRRRLVNFDFEGPAAAAEVHERRRGLGVELPVYQTDQGFDDVKDDARPAWRTERGPRRAGCVKDDGRRHRAARTFSRGQRIGEGFAAAVDGPEGKIRELIVEQKPCRP